MIPQVEAEKRNFKNVNIRFSMRMNYVLPPYDTIELVDVLVKAGYTRLIPAPPPQLSRLKGARLAFAGPIARKGEIVIDINDDRGIMGAASPSPTLSIQGFNDVIQLIKTNLKVDFESIAAFYELIGNMEIETDMNPLERFEQLSKSNMPIEEFSKTMGEAVSLLSLKLSPKGKIPNQMEWFQITIEPDLTKATSTYRISAVYRSEDKSKVQKFITEFLSKISEMLDTIESA